ncbi:hypothetical protein IFM89_000519 [Coptis chinensis]|uniref:Uncharacterized protein n=1 Tax=Coptis chinensis TaxID=261450 RepID=A0A835H2B3_9MAGN|nr:hypothetical protein IFM89_000519 [Coptis chinensis]
MEIQSQVNAMLTMQGINQGAPTRISMNSPSDKHGRRVVAIGRMFGDREDVPENAYRIIVDEILEFNAELFGARGKIFSDIDIGSSITWSKAFTIVI